MKEILSFKWFQGKEELMNVEDSRCRQCVRLILDNDQIDTQLLYFTIRLL